MLGKHWQSYSFLTDRLSKTSVYAHILKIAYNYSLIEIVSFGDPKNLYVFPPTCLLLPTYSCYVSLSKSTCFLYIVNMVF